MISLLTNRYCLSTITVPLEQMDLVSMFSNIFLIGMPLFVLAADTGTVPWQKLSPESFTSNDLTVLSITILLFSGS